MHKTEKHRQEGFCQCSLQVPTGTAITFPLHRHGAKLEGMHCLTFPS